MAESGVLSGEHWEEFATRLARFRPTLGGLQLWADVYLSGTWRIQRNVRTTEYRLLDGWNMQQATGSFAACKEALAGYLAADPSANAGTADRVLLLHGLIRTRHSMDILAWHLQSHGFECYTVSYPSTQAPLEEHAQNLRSIIDGLTGDRPIHLVGHSMGGILARVYLAEGRDPRIARLVTIGTPHLGAEKAAFFHRLGLLMPVMGPAACQLVPGLEGILHRLEDEIAAPTGVEIGIIAAGGPNGQGYSLLVPPDNDGVVTVASTRIAGATDFQLVRGHHSFLPSLLSVRHSTERFLRRGYFRTASDRQPIFTNGTG